MSEIEGVLELMMEFLDGVGAWFRPRNRLRAGARLRASGAVLVSADAGEKGRFLTTLPKGAVLRVTRVSGGDHPTCWATPADATVRQAIVPRDVRGKITASGYELEIGAADLREHFDTIRNS